MSTNGDRPDLASEAAPRWLTEREQQAWMGYRRMRTLLDLQLARDLNRDSGLSEPDYDVLSTLSEVADFRWRAGDLAQRLSWSTSRLTHHVNRMQVRGLVAREACPDDGRGAVIFLTASGWATLRSAAPAHVRSVREHFIDLLTEDQVDALAAIGATVIAHLVEVSLRSGDGDFSAAVEAGHGGGGRGIARWCDLALIPGDGAVVGPVPRPGQPAGTAQPGSHPRCAPGALQKACKWLTGPTDPMVTTAIGLALG
jgi:DNA-binding MarR family transcriptional regulator